MPLLVDTGILYALADRRDEWHARAKAYLEKTPSALIVPVTVLPEVTYLLQTRLGSDAERRFVGSLATGELDVEPLQTKDIARAEALLQKYPEIGFVDATVIAAAERLRLTNIATTDRRHFALVTPAHAAAFELVP